MIDWPRVAVGVLSALLIAGIIAVWKLISDKASKGELAKAIEDLDRDIKAVNIRIDQSLIIIAQAVSKTDLMEKMGAASVRADDKEVRMTRDVTELRTDLKVLADKVAMVDKKLDELPSRVASLEQSRNTGKSIV